MSSPREYNFGTDRLFVNVPAVELARMRAELDESLMDKATARLFTSYDGFSSFYSADWKTDSEWAEFEGWDHNQNYALLLAHWETRAERDGGSYDDPSDWETEWAESMTSDGLHRMDELLFPMDGCAPELERVLKAASYLRDREERQYRQAA